MIARLPRWPLGGTARALFLVLATVALVFVSGDRVPEVAAQPAAGTFIGKVGTTEATIAIAMTQGGTVAVVYVTDGRTHADWFRAVVVLPTGQIPSHTLELRAKSGASLSLETATGAGPRGIYRTPEGAPHPFTTTLATGDAGIYRGVARTGERTLVAGWIVAGDGAITGALLQQADPQTPDIVQPLEPSSLNLQQLMATIPFVGVIEVQKVGMEN
jgi:hypothetical protein